MGVFVLSLLLLLVFLPSQALAQRTPERTADVFKRYAPYVEKVQVVENGSGAKAVIGSAFFVTADGHVVTNFHVVSSLINRPDRYHVELVEQDGTTHPATVAAFDVVHDLAVLRTGLKGKPYFTLGSVTPTQGERLLSIGNPKDLGLSIVEGTYNGLLQHTLYPRIHLTGSLNPGMSGGPTIDERGRVVGINVSTEGNQLSFLVPVERATTLLARVMADTTRRATSLAEVGRQLKQHQEAYLGEMFAGSTQRIDFGPFRVVTQPAPFFRCWADASHEERLPYSVSRHRCETDDDIYLDEDQTTGGLTVSHQLISTRTLNAARFYALYASRFGNDNSPSGTEDFVTNWKCETRNVRSDSTEMRVALCLRRYRKLGELYDAHLKVAVLGRSDVGLVSTLNVTGATYDNITALTGRYLRQISWR